MPAIFFYRRSNDKSPKNPTTESLHRGTHDLTRFFSSHSPSASAKFFQSSAAGALSTFLRARATRKVAGTLSAAALLLGVAACSSSTSSDSGNSSATASSSATKNANFPLTIQNCGHTLTFDKAPERTVSLNQSSTEIQLSLGVADKMVGTATWTDSVLSNLEDANNKVPRLADDAASMDSVIAANPDFVTASFTSTLSSKNSGSFEDYQRLGVPAYISPTDCTLDNTDADSGDGPRGRKFTMEEVYQEVTDLAEIHGVPEKGKELNDSLAKRLDTAFSQKVAEPHTVVYWFANSEAPYVAGGTGPSQFVSENLGLTNIYADQTDQWPQVSWEDLAAKNPDVIILGDLTRKSQTAETAQAKIDYLKNNPVTAQMDAVKNNRFITVAGGDMNPSIRTVDLAEKVATGMSGFSF